VVTDPAPNLFVNCFINRSASSIDDEVVGRVSDDPRDEAAGDDEEDLSLGFTPPPRPRPRLDISKNESELFFLLHQIRKTKSFFACFF
jgi:hypothetical protein